MVARSVRRFIQFLDSSLEGVWFSNVKLFYIAEKSLCISAVISCHKERASETIKRFCKYGGFSGVN